MLDQALADSDDGACVIGADGRILLWNRSAERILGYTAPDVIGRRSCDVFVGRNGDPDCLCHRECHATTFVKMGEPIQTVDLQTRTKAGPPVWINVSILAVPQNGTGGTLTINLFREVAAAKDPLTRRELELLRLMTLGLNTLAAAERLRVSPATVRNHVQNIFGKLGVHSRLEAVAYANRHRLL